MTLKDIRLLRNILNNSLDSLERIYVEHSLDFPSLNEPYTASEAENLAVHSDGAQSINVAVAAAYQLLTTIRQPFATLCDASSLHQLSACLRVSEKLNLPEILRESGTEGCHVRDISSQTGLEPSKIARILRVLATHHIFREVAPDQFANNRISSFFDTGKSNLNIRANPSGKYADAADAAGYIGTFTDDVAKASSHLLEDLEDSEFGNSFLATNAAFHKAFSTNAVYFEWLEEPSNRYRLDRYAACIRGTSLWNDPKSVLDAFHWGGLSEGSLVVDVGGGTGALAMLIATSHPHIQIVIQDREAVVTQGIEHWKGMRPEILSAGRVAFQVHDFFEQQPRSDASIFLVRTICHDWPDDLAVKILRNLRAAASPSAKLVLGDFIIPLACLDEATNASSIPGAATNPVPEPLLANLGKATANTYWIDMTMQVLLNGQERTFSHHCEILSKAGWTVERVNRVTNSQFAYIVAGPA